MKLSVLILAALWILTPVRNLTRMAIVSDGRNADLQDTAGKDIKRYLFIGAETCATRCHNTADWGFLYDTWKKSPHAQSWQSLNTDRAGKYAKKAGIEGNPAESMFCLKCHVTASGADTASIARTYRREDGVTCEACHKGEFKPSTFIPAESDCLKCHNDSGHRIPVFNFEKYSGKISHLRPLPKNDSK
jgi:hypothetical protein